MDDDRALFGSLATCGSTVRAIRVFLLLLLFPLLLILLPTSLPLPVPSPPPGSTRAPRRGVRTPKCPRWRTPMCAPVCSPVHRRLGTLFVHCEVLESDLLQATSVDCCLSFFQQSSSSLHPLPVCVFHLLLLRFFRFCFAVARVSPPVSGRETTVDRSTDRPTNPPSPLSLLGQRLMCSGKGSDLLH